MKIAVFSDIHGNKFALSSILKFIESYGVDESIYLRRCSINWSTSKRVC